MIIDTPLVIYRIKNRENISESITVVTLVEYPRVLEYAGFDGNIIFPTIRDYYLAFDIQRRLMYIGKMGVLPTY